MLDVKAYIDISQYWAVDEKGKPLTVNSVCDRFRGTESELTRYTLKMALNGKLEAVKVDNLVKLAQIATELSGKPVSINDLVRIEK